MISIKIADEALDDLYEGFWFYESQEAGLGDYFAYPEWIRERLDQRGS